MFHCKKTLKSVAICMTLFSVVILIAGCEHGGRVKVRLELPGFDGRIEAEVNRPPPPPPPPTYNYGGYVVTCPDGPANPCYGTHNGWVVVCPDGLNGPCYLAAPPFGPIQPLDPELIPEHPGADGECPVIHVPFTGAQTSEAPQLVSIGTSHVPESTDPDVMQLFTEEGSTEPETPQTVTLRTNLNIVFHNPRNSPYIQTTPDGGLIIDVDSEGLEGETLETLLNEPVTVSMLLPAQYNPFEAYDSQEEEGGMVSVSLDGSVLGCIQTLMDHGFTKLSFGEAGSLVRSGSFIVGTLYLKDDQGTLVPYDVNIPL